MRPIVALLTDFGSQDHYAGAVKGAVLAACREAAVVDIAHELPPHDIGEAAWAIFAVHKAFPAGTVFVAVVDPGVGTSRNIVAVRAAGHYFVAPDNGLLAPLVSRAGDALIVHVGSAALTQLGVHRPSATFHGRDIFAPLAAELAAGRVRVEDLGETMSTLVPSWVDDPTVEAHSVSGVIITIDHFGNLISNIDATLIERFRLPLVHAGNHAFPLLRTYGDTRPGEYLALVNSFGVIEIARAENSAAEGLGLSRGAPVVVRDRTDQP